MLEIWYVWCVNKTKEKCKNHLWYFCKVWCDLGKSRYYESNNPHVSCLKAHTYSMKPVVVSNTLLVWDIVNKWSLFKVYLHIWPWILLAPILHQSCRLFGWLDKVQIHRCSDKSVDYPHHRHLNTPPCLQWWIQMWCSFWAHSHNHSHILIALKQRNIEYC